MKTPSVLRWKRDACVALCVLALGQGRQATADDFAVAMDAAMARMDRGMMVPGTGNPDRDFAAMMIPHHQGAIDMAKAELRFGHDPILRRLAQGVIVEQQQEIAVMRQTLTADPPPAATTGSTSLHSNGTFK